jgi:hypothetical protein
MKSLKLLVLALLTSLVEFTQPGFTAYMANEKTDTGKPAQFWKRKTAMAIGKPDLADASDDDLEKAHDEHMCALANEMEEEPALLANERKTTAAATQNTSKTGDEIAEETRLANEKVTALQKKSGDLLLANALSEGRILPATKKEWEGKFANNFEEAEAALTKEAKKLNTTSRTNGIAGASGMVLANEAERRNQVQTYVGEEMDKNGGDYDRAFSTVQHKHKDLFAAMKAPASKK